MEGVPTFLGGKASFAETSIGSHELDEDFVTYQFDDVIHNRSQNSIHRILLNELVLDHSNYLNVAEP